MDSVGPVESGNYRSLPDLSVSEGLNVDARICVDPRSSANYPHSPQPVDMCFPVSKNIRAETRVTRIISSPTLVDASLPWFMPLPIHKPRKTLRIRP